MRGQTFFLALLFAASCGVHHVRPARIEMASSTMADLPPIPPPLPPEITAPRPCTLHGTGFSGTPVTLVLGENDPTPRALVYGNLTTGVEWSDVPPPGSKKLAHFSYARSGVRAHALAAFETRSFWLAHRAESFDGLVWARPNRRVSVLGVDSGEAIVEVDEHHLRPSIVTARAACEDLGTDTSVRSEEPPLPGNAVHSKNIRWLHLRAQPNGPIERDAEAGAAQINRTTTQNGFTFVHIRFDTVDVTGWVAVSELTERSGGYGLYGIGGIGSVGVSCGGVQRRILRTTELRVGPNAADNEVLGEIVENTNVIVRAIEGRFAKVDVVPCELSPAKDQAFWVDADAID